MSEMSSRAKHCCVSLWCQRQVYDLAKYRWLRLGLKVYGFVFLILLHTMSAGAGVWIAEDSQDKAASHYRRQCVLQLAPQVIEQQWQRLQAQSWQALNEQERERFKLLEKLRDSSWSVEPGFEDLRLVFFQYLESTKRTSLNPFIEPDRQPPRLFRQSEKTIFEQSERQEAEQQALEQLLPQYREAYDRWQQQDAVTSAKFAMRMLGPHDFQRLVNNDLQPNYLLTRQGFHQVEDEDRYVLNRVNPARDQGDPYVVLANIWGLRSSVEDTSQPSYFLELNIHILHLRGSWPSRPHNHPHQKFAGYYCELDQGLLASYGTMPDYSKRDHLYKLVDRAQGKWHSLVVDELILDYPASERVVQQGSFTMKHKKMVYDLGLFLAPPTVRRGVRDIMSGPLSSHRYELDEDLLPPTIFQSMQANIFFPYCGVETGEQGQGLFLLFHRGDPGFPARGTLTKESPPRHVLITAEAVMRFYGWPSFQNWHITKVSSLGYLASEYGRGAETHMNATSLNAGFYNLARTEQPTVKQRAIATMHQHIQSGDRYNTEEEAIIMNVFVSSDHIYPLSQSNFKVRRFLTADGVSWQIEELPATPLIDD